MLQVHNPGRYLGVILSDFPDYRPSPVVLKNPDFFGCVRGDPGEFLYCFALNRRCIPVALYLNKAKALLGNRHNVKHAKTAGSSSAMIAGSLQDSDCLVLIPGSFALCVHFQSKLG